MAANSAKQTLRRALLRSLAFSGVLCGLAGCASHQNGAIAVIPRTTGTMLWEPEHGGAELAGRNNGLSIYWNAPAREDDINAQIALVERVSHSNFQGMILAPDQVLSLMSPVRRSVDAGIFTVIVGSPLTIPASDKLSYILNDDEAGGRMAAQRLGAILHGTGAVAVIGINPDIAGVLIRSRSFEHYLNEHFPHIEIVERRMGSFNVPHEQQVAEEVLKANPKLDAIVALLWPSARGAMATIDSNPSWHSVKVIAFDPEALAFESPSLDSIVAQNTHDMGYRAVELIHGGLNGQPMPKLIQFQPVLITRDNVNSDSIRAMTSMDWGPAPLHADRSTTP